MDSPQYLTDNTLVDNLTDSFKPYYKWIVLNTLVRQQNLLLSILEF